MAKYPVKQFKPSAAPAVPLDRGHRARIEAESHRALQLLAAFNLKPAKPEQDVFPTRIA